MKHRAFVWLVGAAVFIVAAGFSSGSARAADAKAKKPNFVILFADDLGYGDLGCYGHRRSARRIWTGWPLRGLRFTDFYSAAPVCSPSRAALLTGRLPIRSGMYGYVHRVIYADSKGGLPSSEITLAQALKPAGYATALIGKWHVGGGPRPETMPMAHGFDYWYGLPFSNDMKPHSRGAMTRCSRIRPSWTPSSSDTPRRPSATSTSTRTARSCCTWRGTRDTCR